MSRRCGLAASLLLVGACAGNEEMPGMPWLISATVRSLAGMPPAPPDLYAEPVSVSDTLRFTAITAGGEHTCALTVDGETYCWGSNRYEQLGRAAVTETCGNGTFSCSSKPVRLENAPRFTALAATSRGTCGLDASGAAHCWGYGLAGRAADGLPASSAVPVEVPGDHAFVALASNAASNGRACGLAGDGRVWCWGLSIIEPGGATGPFAGPDRVPMSPTFRSMSFGASHGCGTDESHNAFCWGNNTLGQLGTGASAHEGGVRESPAPVAVRGGLELDRVVAGGAHSCGLDLEGSAYCWGQGFPVDASEPAFSRVSGGPLPHGSQPVPLDMRGTPWIALDAGGMQTCGLTADGAIYCFSATPMDVDKRPVRVESDRTFAALAVGRLHACAIDAAASAYCWGRSHAGQVGRPPSGGRW